MFQSRYDSVLADFTSFNYPPPRRNIAGIISRKRKFALTRIPARRIPGVYAMRSRASYISSRPAAIKNRLLAVLLSRFPVESSSSLDKPRITRTQFRNTISNSPSHTMFFIPSVTPVAMLPALITGRYHSVFNVYCSV